MRGLIKLGLAFVAGWSVARVMEAQLTGVPITPLLLTEWNKSVRSIAVQTPGAVLEITPR